MGFMAGKRALIVGVASDRSIATGIAEAFAREGAELAFTYQNEKLQGRVTKLATRLGANTELCFPCDVSSDEEDVFGELQEISGTVLVQKANDNEPFNVEDGEMVFVNDQIFTLENSRALIELSNETIIRISPKSTFILEEIDETSAGVEAKLKLEIGRIWIILNGGSIDVDTPSGVASVRGSYLHVSVHPNKKGLFETLQKSDSFFESTLAQR